MTATTSTPDIDEIARIVNLYCAYYGNVVSYSSYGTDTLDSNDLDISQENVETGENELLTLAYLQSKITEAEGG
jgi:hypothetical protein